MVGPGTAELAAAQLARLERPSPGAAVIVAGSPFADGAVFRIAGERVEAVTAALRAVNRAGLPASRRTALSRRW